MCNAASEIPQYQVTAFLKLRDTVILAALAGGVYEANTSGQNWQTRVGVSLLSAAGAVGLLTGYIGKQRHR